VGGHADTKKIHQIFNLKYM